MGQERLGPSYFFISLLVGPLNSLVWNVPSVRYARGLGWRIHCGVEVTESSTNKQHIIIKGSREHGRAGVFIFHNLASDDGAVHYTPDCSTLPQDGSSDFVDYYE